MEKPSDKTQTNLNLNPVVGRRINSGLSPIILAKQWLLTMVLGLTVALSACSSEKAGLDKLRELCEKDAGLTINKTVEAGGYYDATGSNVDLIHSDYQFFEYCDDNPTVVDLTSDPGCWRVSKVKRESGRCYERLDKKLAKFVVEPYPEFLKSHCIAVEKIEKPTARYSYHSGLKSWPAKNGVSIHTKNKETIMDRVENEIIGSYVTYLFDKNPPYSVPMACSDFIENIPSYAEAKFVNSVIKPIQGRVK